MGRDIALLQRAPGPPSRAGSRWLPWRLPGSCCSSGSRPAR
jgi:hypothetical protein